MLKHHKYVVILTLVVVFTISLRAQDATRHIWDTAFLAPKADKSDQTGKSGSSHAAQKPRYTVLTPRVPVKNVDPSTVVGITVWRLREYKPGDSGERLLGHKGLKTVELEPKRVSARTLFDKDDKVRITVEAAREGYLYIVDREQYSNGKQGEPYLIFPVTAVRGGENHVLPGQIIELPAQDDDPPYFDMERNSPDQIGERLTVLITPTPLTDVHPKDDRQRLSPEQCAQWERQVHVNAGMAEATAGQALNWSQEEKNAGANPAIGLSATAPLPQTLFYSPDSKAQEPTIVNLVLNYAPMKPSKHPMRNAIR